jgi:hypothetical protein
MLNTIPIKGTIIIANINQSLFFIFINFTPKENVFWFPYLKIKLTVSFVYNTHF